MGVILASRNRLNDKRGNKRIPSTEVVKRSRAKGPKIPTAAIASAPNAAVAMATTVPTFTIAVLTPGWALRNSATPCINSLMPFAAERNQSLFFSNNSTLIFSMAAWRMVISPFILSSMVEATRAASPSYSPGLPRICSNLPLEVARINSPNPVTAYFPAIFSKIAPLSMLPIWDVFLSISFRISTKSRMLPFLSVVFTPKSETAFDVPILKRTDFSVVPAWLP
ncbi:Uncharacterised protein [Yersinia pseudotuberculosis]|nr:Uncharacterised protein [Yersinia pseudotuberculosis]